ncbi:MAG TPA: DUF433 domain-containing protein [Planctomycetota bacterium]|nr:DUF433 domain-containing protein [Planctomycetota bacterium]
MSDLELLERISFNPHPVISGTRLSVQFILNLLAHESTPAEIMSQYPELTREDILACLLYASQSFERHEPYVNFFVYDDGRQSI